MIDFRYHLVSIISVFLALAVGIVVGTTALNGVIVDDLRQRVDGLAADKRAREQTIGDQQRVPRRRVGVRHRRHPAGGRPDSSPAAG